MPRILFDILIFLLVNALGYFSAHLCFVLGTSLGLINVTDPNLDPGFVRALFHGIIMTWIVCAVFSLTSFFFKGKIRLAFLLAPVVIPMGYGLRMLFLL